MTNPRELISQLFLIRNQYGKEVSSQKLDRLNELAGEKITGTKVLQTYHDILLFLIAYPDNKSVYEVANRSLQQLHLYIQSHKKIKEGLFNSGITNTSLCAAFGFEIVKWLRLNSSQDIRLSSFEADDGQIQSILSAVLRRVESEILLDGNADWRSWLKRSMKKGEDILDQLIAVFDESDIHPGARDELWSALGINVEINFSTHDCLPGSLITPYYHRSLIKKGSRQQDVKPVRVKLDVPETSQLIACARMILLRHLREIDPISFTAAHFVSYYQLGRGLSVALMEMIPGRRNPIDSYLGYTVFKNGLPVAYAGSWILFDSCRIGLNVFPAYRGGESQYIFEQVLRIHQQVYHLNRFSVDPYQIGKDNSDGIQSGAFWVYHRAGFRPIRKEQKQIAEEEAQKISSKNGYRSSVPILKKLAESRMELVLQKKAFRFDATDLSLAYARILKDQYNNNRKHTEEFLLPKLAEWLQLKNYHEEKLLFVLKNWCALLFPDKKEPVPPSARIRRVLKKLFEFKTKGTEEDYIAELQRAGELRKFFERMLEEYVTSGVVS